MTVVLLPRAKLATAAVVEDRRALVQAARQATGQSAPSPDKPPVLAPARPSPPFEQAWRAAAAWAYMTPFLVWLPFFASPPAWIAVFSQMRPRDDHSREH